ncbi:MAG: metallophosphoesterase, partial [Actinomycetota bacterium]|nr:metallophosphoesterase [Actinomycetota bacterium]
APGQATTAGECRMAATADLVVAARPDAVLTLGDNQYPTATLERFQRGYDATWGRFKDITRPTLGNHDAADAGGRGHFDYFGGAAGAPGQGWYSFDLGGWHLIALNSNCATVRGCGPGSPQHEWLRADLAAHPARCTLAYWHHARFSSGLHGDDASTAPLWQALHEAGADVVLVGHDHHYERLAPLAPDGRVDPAGMRQFVVGTGGRSLYPVLGTRPGSEAVHASGFGVLLLTLGDGSYEWRFAGEAPSPFADAGRGACR